VGPSAGVERPTVVGPSAGAERPAGADLSAGVGRSAGADLSTGVERPTVVRTSPGVGRPTVVVVGLGPAGPDLVTAGVTAAVEATPHRFVRTTRHPSASLLAPAASFDHLYEQADTIDAVYTGIVESLVAAATEHGRVLYAVPGSPVVAEHTVELLVADERVAVELVPALSFVDLAWVRLGIDPVERGVRLVDGHRFAAEAAGERGPLLVGQCDDVDVLSEIKLAIGDVLDTVLPPGAPSPEASGSDPASLRSWVPHPEPMTSGPDPWNPSPRGRAGAPDVAGREPTVVVLQRLGLADEVVVELPWHQLDRAVVPDHLTSVYVPALAAPVAGEVAAFAEVVRRLRAECPWDREQTHHSLRRHLLEEAYEVLEAIDHLDVEAGEGFDHLEEELGDLLFQVVFHSVLAAEEGHFTLADVASGVAAKLIGRHPHVFAGATAGSAEEVAAGWEQLKKAEKGRASVMDGIPDALPALLYASKIQKKAASQGVDWRELVTGDAGVSEIGRRLLEVVDAARTAGDDAETELRIAAEHVRDRYRAGEASAPPAAPGPPADVATPPPGDGA
jgi:tetrapyrrole methylase family protein/MazG family protein